MKRATALALGLALGLGLLGGAAREVRADDVTTVTYANASDITTLDPRYGTSTITACIMADLYSTLVKTAPDGSIVNDAAESLERVDDVTWHVVLRDDVYFTNGDQLTSADVKYTFDSLQNEEAGYSLAGDFKFISAEVISDTELNLITEYPFAGLPLRLNYVKIIPSAYVEEVGDEEFAKAPIGSGPFKFVSWAKDDKVVLEKNPDYYGDVPQFDQLVYKVIPEAADRVAALQAGEIDIACALPTTQAVSLANTPGIAVASQPSTRVVWVQFNTIGEETPLNDPLVRQALNYAIDRDSLIAGVMDSYAVKVASISTPEYEDYDPSVEGYTYDPEKARELLAEAGYADGFALDFSVTPGLLNATDVAQYVAAQLGEIGITVNVIQEDSQTQREKVGAGTVAPLFLNGIGGPYCNIDLIASIAFTTGARYCTWNSTDEFLELSHNAVSAVDPEERAALHSQLQQYMVDEAPALWLYQQDTLYAYSTDRIEGWTSRTDEVVLMDGVTVK